MGLKLTLAWGIVLLIGAVIGGGRMRRSLRGDSPGPRGLLMLLPFAAAVMLWMMWLNIAVTPFEEWNSARVAPVVAWWMGMPLYYPPGEGPGTAFIYPPVSAILRLPVGLSSTPTIAVIASALLNAIFYHLPLLLFIRGVRGPWVMRLIGLLAIWGFSLDLRSLNYSAYWVHADAPALGFGLLACMVVMKRGRRARRGGRMMLAAALLALAIGSKQTMAPLLVVLPGYVLMRWGARAAMTLAWATLAILAAGFLVCIGIWGYDAIRFNWFTIAAGQPWQMEENGRVVSFLIWTGTLISEAAGPAIAMGVLWMLNKASATPHRRRGRLIHEAWFLPLVIAVVMVPLAIMSVAKRGGWGNSLSVSIYFLVVAIGAMIAGFKLRGDRAVVGAVVGSTALLAIALAAWSVTPFTSVRATLIDLANLDRNPEQAAFEFVRQHPGQVYFPRNPLATLMAEGRYYIYEFGLLDEITLGDRFKPDAQRMRQNLPVDMRLIAFPPERTAGIARMEMPGFSQRVEVDELPGWIVFSRPRVP